MEPGASELHNVKDTSSDTIHSWIFFGFVCDTHLYVHLSVYPVKSHEGKYDIGTSHMKKGWEHWNYSTWRRQGSEGISSMCTNMWRKGAKKMKPGSFQVAPSSRTRNNENKQTQAVPSQEKVFYCEGDWDCPGRLWIFHSWRNSKTVWSSATGYRRLCLRQGVALTEFPSNLNYRLLYYFYYTQLCHTRAKVINCS